MVRRAALAGMRAQQQRVEAASRSKVYILENLSICSRPHQQAGWEHDGYLALFSCFSLSSHCLPELLVHSRS